MKSVKSGSEIMHGILISWQHSGYFTAKEFVEYVRHCGYNYSYGSVTGFISHCKAKSRIRPIAKNGTAEVYELIDEAPWEFKHPSMGSVAGRTIQPKPKEKLDLPQATSDPLPSLSDELLRIATEVSLLEARQDKTLADFTTDELLEELKKRTKE